MSLISVVIPVYNVENYVRESIDSVLAQTHKDLEVIIVDDGSTDKSGSIVDEYDGTDARIRILHTENGGLSAARNRGTEIASGEYIAYLDSDDIMHPRCLEMLYKAISVSDAEVSVCKAVTFNDGSSADEQLKKALKGVKNVTKVISGRDAAMKIVRDSEWNYIVAYSKLYSRKCIASLHYPEGRIHEDEFVTYKVFYESDKVAVTPFPGLAIRSRSGSITGARYNEKRLHKLIALRSAIRWFDKRGDNEMVRYARLRYLTNLQISWYRVRTQMEGKKRIRLQNRIYMEYKKFYHAYWPEIKTICKESTRASAVLFYKNPEFYKIFADVYLIFGEIR